MHAAQKWGLTRDAMWLEATVVLFCGLCRVVEELLLKLEELRCVVLLCCVAMCCVKCCRVLCCKDIGKQQQRWRRLKDGTKKTYKLILENRKQETKKKKATPEKDSSPKPEPPTRRQPAR